MTAVLADLTDLKRYLGISSTSMGEFTDTSNFDTFLQGLLDNVESMLEGECGVEFAAGATITDEPHDGTGTDVVYSDHPIDTLTSVKIGIDPDNPDSEYTAQPTDIDFTGSRVLLRGGVGAGETYYDVFPRGRKNVYISYTSLAYAPSIAQQAVFEAVAFLYRRRGHEHVTATSVGELGSLQPAARFDFLPAWTRCVAQLRVPMIR